MLVFTISTLTNILFGRNKVRRLDLDWLQLSVLGNLVKLQWLLSLDFSGYRLKSKYAFQLIKGGDGNADLDLSNPF